MLPTQKHESSPISKLIIIASIIVMMMILLSMLLSLNKNSNMKDQLLSSATEVALQLPLQMIGAPANFSLNQIAPAVTASTMQLPSNIETPGEFFLTQANKESSRANQRTHQ